MEETKFPATTWTIWSLNGESFSGAGEHNPEGEARPLQWLKSLSRPGALLPDVLCLQDFRGSLVEHLTLLPHFHFAPMTRHRIGGVQELLGICIASRWPITAVDIHYTWGDGVVRQLEGVDENNKRMQPTDVADRLILRTQNRVVIACTIRKPGASDSLRIATHHGLWVRDGVPTTEQRESTRSLCSFLAEQAKTHGGLVYLADFNPDKDGEVLRAYVESGAHDWLPTEIVTTLAAHHPLAALDIRSDCIMTWPNELREPAYAIADVHTDAAPGSDHLMLCCTARSPSSAPAPTG
jgi:hypothetical protein